ncbi:non-ribosomal peptide synthetase [Streptomyces sp. FB2]|uniref:non-ribosomal peptide synthetase n=1 Tax=Streptomyces sp. FB2 TaxID=2902454 RepID=UPI001F30E1C6|nr:non-ribosomal peptide synthetase [Streptomyces sp. FB2]MCF2535722.1 non-ribosomal peptide synthetase [Streptomyces sp. FB2]
MKGLLDRADCIGPIALPADALDGLRSLAEAAGVDEFTALSLCAGVLAARLPHPGTDCRVRVTRQEAEAVVPGPGTPDAETSFREALRQAARAEAPLAAEHGEEPPVAVSLLIGATGRNLYVESLTDASDVPTPQAWAHAFCRLLTGLTDDPDAPMLSHPLVGPEERERILHGLNPYREPVIRYRTMAGPFEEQAARTPDAVALQDEDGTTVSYRELNERANRLAHHLRALGAGPGARIGICLRRGIPQVVAVYAAVKTGATYVPLDADLPDQRIALILDDADPLLVLTDPACRGHLPDGAWQIHDVDTELPGAGLPVTNPDVDAGPGLVHILYTSGTTGRPKGVVSRTEATLANIFWMQRQYPYQPGETALFKASPGFDISIWELFWPLYHGARLVICRPGGERDPRHLARLTRDHDVSLVFLVPTMMTAYLEELAEAAPKALKWVVCGGEPMSPRIPESFSAVLPGSALVNAFGPTEAGPVTDNIVDVGSVDGTVPVGHPADNFRVTVLDSNLDLVPVGTPGEAYISGRIGLADGYWGQAAQTSERFVADPYGPPGSRMYRTGDLVRQRPDGALEHLGRIDRQVKIRGLRIEPGEVESVLAAHPAVADCAVLAHGQPLRLLAFVVPAGQDSAADLDPAAVLAHAAEVLPAQMRPDRVVPVDYLPATVNGKIDQGELIKIWQELTERERPVEPPADELEAALVRIYHRVLGRSSISVLDTFVELGGHSLLTFRLRDECRAALGVEPDAARLMHDTLRDVAATIRRTTIPSARD